LSTRRRILTATLLAAGIALFGLFTRQGSVLALAIPFVIYAMALLLSDLMLKTPTFRVLRAFSDPRTHENEEVEVTLSIAHDDPQPVLVSLEDVVCDGMRLIDGEPWIVRELAPGEGATTTYSIAATRGQYEQRHLVGAVWARMGLAIRDIQLRHDSQLASVPHYETLQEIEIRPKRTHAFAGAIRTDRAGSGLEILGCREYVLGDDIRKINWRASARREELIVNLFEQEKMTDVNIIIDARANMHQQIGSEKTFDLVARGAAGVASAFLRQGDRVGLLIYGDTLNWTYPAAGRLQMESILHSLAQARPSSREAFGRLRFIPTQLFATGSQLIIFSTLGSEEDVAVPEELMARGYSVLLVHPDTVELELTQAVGKPFSQLARRVLNLHNQVVLSRLSRAGVGVVNWDLTEPLAVAFHNAQTETRGVRR